MSERGAVMSDSGQGLVGAPRTNRAWAAVDIRGEIDFSRSRELRAALEELVAPQRKLIINLKDVSYLDSTALATLVACRRQLGEAGGKLRLCGLNQRVRGLIEMTQLHRVFEIFATEEEAATK